MPVVVADWGAERDGPSRPGLEQLCRYIARERAFTQTDPAHEALPLNLTDPN